ncbi:hypothetical protein CDL15_Pgr018073 [Punica granatum]|uniref:Trehalase n=1 Tax=Punica granatum TaxID=22663 RepID=A0A218WI88_PUNGR|nr:hypothetical protein CDL15_Pgr018073 [Punica granatum]
MSSCSSARGPVAPPVPLIAFLERVQEAALSIFGASGFDPKRYVDLSLKSDLPAAERAFDELRASATALDLETFMRSYFEDAGGDLEHYEPPDYTPEPEGFLPAVKSREVREWALEVHALWKSLSRKISDGVRTRPDSHTLRGLLASKMFETAKAVVKNLIYLANRYGYVLNGARAYYTNRSQPPLLSAMVSEIYDATHDLELVKISLQALLNEYEFWNSGKHKVTIQDAEGRIHTLSRYYAKWDKPRPESSTTDKEYASKLLSASEKANLYWELASAAESGWDFSARWMRDFPNGWAPLQHMIVEGLVKSSSTDARQMAEDIAVRWIRTNYAAYKQTGKMHEKYNVVNCGEFGGGGEYVPQTGFGWSNGVVLAFLEEFGWPQDREIIDRE